MGMLTAISVADRLVELLTHMAWAVLSKERAALPGSKTVTQSEAPQVCTGQQFHSTVHPALQASISVLYNRTLLNFRSIECDAASGVRCSLSAALLPLHRQ